MHQRRPTIASSCRSLFIAVTALCITLTALAAAQEDSPEWKRVRQIRIPPLPAEGPVGIPLESAVLENCRPDLADLRIVASDGSVPPVTLTDPAADSDNEALPSRGFRITEKSGKWTEVWVDTGAKARSRGILIQTRSKGFVRKVEVRGSHGGPESYVIRMDGLIADLDAPVPLSSLGVFYPEVSFQHLLLRIINADQAPLKVDGVHFYPPRAPDAPSTALSLRITENRVDGASGSTIIGADLGEKRFPISRVTITTGANEFTKKVTIMGSRSAETDEWSKIHEGTLFRIRKHRASAENLTAAFTPQTVRYVRVELSGGKNQPVAVDKIQTTAAIRYAVFTYRPGLTYKLTYDNPKAKGADLSATPASVTAREIAETASETELGPEQRNVVSRPKPKPPEKPKAEPTSTSSLLHTAGIVMLLLGLLLLFSFMLRARSGRRSDRRAPRVYIPKS